MTPAITLAVLFAALCHAGWNAIIRMRGDKLVSMTLLGIACGLLVAPGLFFVPLLPAAAWPMVIASTIFHTGYNAFLALSYTHGELSKVYPLVRGSAPLLTLALAVLFLEEPVDASGMAGIVVLAAGIMALALDRGWRVLVESRRGILYVAATSLCITGYTLADGLGARAAGNAHHYVIWLFLLQALPFIAFMLFVRARDVARAARTEWLPSLVGGALSVAAYWIVIWAFTVAPIPIVAALRETSILFAGLIGMALLGEKITAVRAVSTTMVLAGLALMRL